MSGHSKWSQIKRQKGVADIKRGLAFTKLANAITIAVKTGGGIGDPEQNFKLRLAIEKAREVNMPKENIERAIERGLGKDNKGALFEEIVYEGFGPGGTALIIEAASDNRLRTTGQVKQVLQSYGATMGTPGAVAYQFATKGVIHVKKNSLTLDELYLKAADSGAEDIEDEGDRVAIYTKPEELMKVKQELEKELEVEDAELTRVPLVTVPVPDSDTASKIVMLLQKLETLDDVLKVYSNFDIPDQFINP